MLLEEIKMSTKYSKYEKIKKNRSKYRRSEGPDNLCYTIRLKGLRPRIDDKIRQQTTRDISIEQ